MTDRVKLKALGEKDLPILFTHQRDPVAKYMAAFTPKGPTDRKNFMARWRRILRNRAVNKKAIVVDGRVIGMIARFKHMGELEVTYWLDRACWNHGFATEALGEFVKRLPTRPLYARAAKDNFASIRVLEKCAFTKVGEEKGFAGARNEEIEEVIFRLD
ncbi:GNAT family N-acetyltransferase (plasmid) [Rhizobium leguminosarum]